MLARCDDGYHDLATIFQTLALHDVVTVEVAPQLDQTDRPVSRARQADGGQRSVVVACGDDVASQPPASGGPRSVVAQGGSGEHDRIEIRCATPGVPLDCDNLVWRAAERLRQALGREADAARLVITLDKRIPAQAGLGGGSADAAATLLALRELWSPALALEVLRQVAASLGADVPFFLTGGRRLARAVATC